MNARAMWMVALLAGVAPTLQAKEHDEAELTRLARKHYQLGVEAYRAGQFEAAIGELKQAYLLKRLPALLLNLGQTYRKLGDVDLALHFYRRYLDEAPAGSADRDEATATVRALQAELSSAARPAAPPADEPVAAAPVAAAEPAAPADDDKLPFSHTVIEAAPPDTPLDVRVSMAPVDGVKAFVYYRGAGESDYRRVVMRPRGAEKIGRIPAAAMTDIAVQYYVEARGADGAVLQSSGTQANPNIIMIDPTARPQVVAMAEPRARATEPARDDEPATSHRELDEETAPLATPDKPRRALGGLFYTGLALTLVGVGAAAGGVYCDLQAQHFSNSVAKDSRAGQFSFSDPTAPGGADDASFQRDGLFYNQLGLGLTIGGAAAGVLGVVFMIADAARHHGAAEKRTARRFPAEQAWHVAPTLGARQVGAAFTF
jgi:hypothetical protein